MPKISAIIISFILVMNISMRSQEIYTAMSDIEGFKTKMAAFNQKTESIESDFTQLKHLSFLEEDVKSMGKFYFRKKNQLRWEYGSPFFYLIIFNNDSILIQDENKTSIYDAASGRMFREINNIMLGMVDGTILENDNFTIEYLELQSSYILELTPKGGEMKEFLSRIRLFINRNNLTADEIYMIESSGDFTHIRFFNKRLNEDIPQHIFDLP
ncbi:MAG TPA: outer membrane lipoprotein carrier protein LolA [Bacteroidales bacterium]|nr:outer membrane lipoprotein carrier protein LolA [Bacteroidales bacterium]